MTRQDRIHNLRDHRVFVADNAGEDALPGAQLRDQVVAQLVLDRPRDAFRRPLAVAKITKGLGQVVRRRL